MLYGCIDQPKCVRSVVSLHADLIWVNVTSDHVRSFYFIHLLRCFFRELIFLEVISIVEVVYVIDAIESLIICVCLLHFSGEMFDFLKLF